MLIKDVKTRKNVNIIISTRTEKKKSITNYSSASPFPRVHPECQDNASNIRQIPHYPRIDKLVH